MFFEKSISFKFIGFVEDQFKKFQIGFSERSPKSIKTYQEILKKSRKINKKLNHLFINLEKFANFFAWIDNITKNIQTQTITSVKRPNNISFILVKFLKLIFFYYIIVCFICNFNLCVF